MSSWAFARAAVLGAAATLVVGISAIPSGSQTTPTAGTSVVAVSGHATGVFVDFAVDPEVVDLSTTDFLTPSVDVAAASGDVSAAAFEHFTAGPAPTVTLPPEGGGPFTDSLPSLDIELPGEDPLQVSGAVNVSTEGALGAAGRAASTARVEDFGDEGGSALGMSAELVDVACSSDLTAGPVGTTHIADGLLILDEGSPDPIPEDPAPNTVLVDETRDIPGEQPDELIRIQIRIVANEQTVGANDITVRGLHLTATFSLVEVGGPEIVFETVEEIIGETACGVVPGAEILPTFTG